MKARQWRRGVLMLAAASLMASGLLFLGAVSRKEMQRGSVAALRRPTGQAQMVGFEALPEIQGEECEWVPASASTTLLAALQQEQDPARMKPPTAAQAEEVKQRKPVRVIKDGYSAFSSVAVDTKHDEVVMTDESLFQILTYKRTENTPRAARMSEPKRMLGGLKTYIEFQCALYIDQRSGDIYAVNNDTVDRLVIFSREQKGDEVPSRIVRTPHTTYGIAVDEPTQELFLTVQEAAAVSVFRKNAKENEAPLRLIQGPKTGLGDPHGIAVDSTRDLLFVTNFGSVAEKDASRSPVPTTRAEEELYSARSAKANWPLARESAVPGSGKFVPPSITVYPKNAQGDVVPTRVIQGPKTQLNWPTALSVDTKRGVLFVANDTGDSILVFDVNANGDSAPARVIKGPKSMIKSPTGVFYDADHDELWVSNFGNHTATVYKGDASGDAAPLRVVRSAPVDVPVPNIGNAYAPAYDSKRDEILVPN
jgi:DNA-binding beta-propeller fold protein YncE